MSLMVFDMPLNGETYRIRMDMQRLPHSFQIHTYTEIIEVWKLGEPIQYLGKYTCEIANAEVVSEVIENSGGQDIPAFILAAAREAYNARLNQGPDR
ncbi:MAG: hypothetical protein WAZ18_06240 [Alphaproteobacteria bacterium]